MTDRAQHQQADDRTELGHELSHLALDLFRDTASTVSAVGESISKAMINASRSDVSNAVEAFGKLIIQGALDGAKNSGSGSGRSDLGDRPNRIHEAPIDRSPKFKFPEDKPLDAKDAQEYAEKIGKWMKEDLAKDGKLSPAVRDRLQEMLMYGINHGQKGMNEMVKLLNKQLEGTGFSVQTNGKPWSHYQTCFPDRRGDYHGDFVSFDLQKAGKQADSISVKVSSGDFERR